MEPNMIPSGWFHDSIGRNDSISADGIIPIPLIINVIHFIIGFGRIN